MSRRTRRRWFALAMVTAVCAGVVIRGQIRPSRAAGVRPQPNFRLQTVAGQPLTFADCAGPMGLVLIFTGNDCPNSNKILPRLADLAAKYAPRGIKFLGVNSNASQTAEAVAAHASTHAIPFPVHIDPHNFVADLLKVERTCEAIVIDQRGSIRYQGAVDDQFGRGTSRPAPSQNYLADALDAVLLGKPVAVATTRAIGCPIERFEPVATPRVRPPAASIQQVLAEREQEAGPIAVGPVTYARDVAPIVQRKCQSCHRPGQEAPFALMNFDDCRTRLTNIQEVVADRRMPPWHADPRFGHFSNDRSLTPRDRATLLAWVEQGGPLGDPAGLPPPRSFPAGWSIGTPDLVFAIPEANDVPAIGVLDYVIITVPTNFTADTWIQAAEIRPEVRSIVHHIIVQILAPGVSPKTQGDHFATYVPGDAPTIYTPGIAKLIPAGSRLKFGIHYVPDGVAHRDRSSIGLVLAKGPVRQRAYTRSVENSRFSIPPHAAAHPVTSTFTTDANLSIYSFSPHMHVRGKDFQYTATYPDGRSEVLLSVPAYDFGWQSSYILAEPKPIPQGTRIDCQAHFDNSTANPANPNPSQQVDWGEQSFEEMMIGYFDYVIIER